MSVDHSVVTERPIRDPLFLHIKAGMTVIVEENGDWWMADVETRVVSWIKADLVTHVVPRIHEPVAT